MIIDNLYVGSINDAIKYGNNFDLIITIMEYVEMYRDERMHLFTLKTPILYIPVLVTEYKNTNTVYDVVPVSETTELTNDIADEFLNSKAVDKIIDILRLILPKGKVLVHCGAGQERAPLICVWYLHKEKNWNIDRCYDFVKEKRLQTIEQKEWLKELLKNA